MNQSYGDFELVLVDDGSPDNSGRICDKYARLDNRIKVIHQENQGVSSARNNGIDISSGDYLCFVDSDDWFAKNTLELLANEIKYNHSDVVVFGYSVVYQDKKEDFLLETGLTMGKMKENFICTEWKNFSCNKCFKKNLFQNVYFPVGKYYEDEYVIPSVIYSAKKISVIPKVLYYYNQCNPNSITRNFDSKREYDLLNAVIRNYELAKSKNLKCKSKCLENAIAISQRILIADCNDKLLTEEEKKLLILYVLKNYLVLLRIVKTDIKPIAGHVC